MSGAKRTLPLLAVLCFALFLLYGVYFNAFGANAESMMVFFDITESRQGFVMTIQSLGGIVMTVLLGLFSAVIAFGLQWGLYAAVAQGIANSDSLQILNVVPFTRIWQFVALVFLGTGILVGVGGSLTAIRRFLRV